MINKKNPTGRDGEGNQNKSKDTYFQVQSQRTFLSFLEYPKRKHNHIEVVRKGICPISKHRAGFYTTNPEMFPAIVEPSNTVKR